MNRPTAAIPFFIALIATFGDAQEPVGPTVPRPVAGAAATGLPELVVPVHTAPDDPIGGAYGTWAAGATYKVSFHDGMTFVPLLGSDYPENRPWRWTTVEVRVGEQILMREGTSAEHRWTDLRYEYRFGAVTEAYDVSVHGLEQTFVIERKPNAAGDLVVTGVIDTALRATSGDALHRALEFCDAAGRQAVCYGEAYAVDADGRKIAITTAFDGQRIELSVPAAFVAAAKYPLVVDPLLNSPRLASTSYVMSIDTARDDDANKTWYAYCGSASASDQDLRFYRADDDYQNSVLVFADVTTYWDSEECSVATVGGGAKAVVAFTRVFTTSRGVRWHAHDLRNTAMSTSYGFAPQVSGQHLHRPQIGGTRAFGGGRHAMLVFQRDTTGGSYSNVSDSKVMFARIDLGGPLPGTISTPYPIDDVGSRADQERPAVTPIAESGGGWLVAWQEYHTPPSGAVPWAVAVRRINALGQVSPGILWARGSRSSAHKLAPVIAGESGRYLLIYAESAFSRVPFKTGLPSGHSFVAERIDWSGITGSFVHPPTRIHDAGERRFIGGGIAHDSITASHWGFSYVDTTTHLHWTDRLGYRGRVVENLRGIVATSRDSVPGGVTFDDDNQWFGIVYGEPYYYNTRTMYVTARRMVHATVNPPTHFGNACTTATQRWRGSPYIGAEFAALEVIGVRPNSAALVMLSKGPGFASLTRYGMPGCELRVASSGADYLGTFLLVADGNGTARLQFPLPEDLRAANLFSQFFPLDPAANYLGMTATDAMHTTIDR